MSAKDCRPQTVVLWTNLVTDNLPCMALAAEPAERGIMYRPPRPPHESMFAHGTWQHILGVGLLIGLLSIGTQAWAYHSTGFCGWMSETGAIRGLTVKIRFTLLALLGWIMLSGSFAVKCSSGSGTALIVKNGASSNRPPEATDSSLTATVNVTASGFMQASDPDGDALIFSLVVSPALGVVNVTDTTNGAFTYLSNVSGFDSFSFKANDGKADSNVATVQIAVVEQQLVWQALDRALEEAGTNPDASPDSASGCDREGELLLDDSSNDKPISFISGETFCTAVDPFDTAHVITADEGCDLLRSFDGGLTWEVLKMGGLVPDSCESILIHFNPSVPGLLYVGINSSAGGSLLLRSIDGAQSWQLLDAPKQGRVKALVSTTNDTDVRLIAQFMGDDVLYSVTDKPFGR